jgi:hypothetical protein
MLILIGNTEIQLTAMLLIFTRFTKLNNYVRNVCKNKELVDFQNCLGVISRLCHGRGQKTSHFKRLPWQQKAASRCI